MLISEKPKLTLGLFLLWEDNQKPWLLLYQSTQEDLSFAVGLIAD